MPLSAYMGRKVLRFSAAEEITGAAVIPTKHAACEYNTRR
jgi:hypothetical protein